MKICPSCGARYAPDVGLCAVDGQPLIHDDGLIGRTVGGRYRIISRLGSGGMSSVYLARHVLIERLVAVKTLRRDLAADREQRDRFVREARAVNRINHANIVEITDFGEAPDGLVYLVMEYVPGKPLQLALGRGVMEARRALHICVQIGEALARAHEMGVIHRDLKPSNILLHRGPEGEAVKVLDFGIAKILDAPALTASHQLFGTPGYIAPEYIQSADIDGRADLYSLGIMLYEMVSGAMPFDYEYPGDLLVKHVTEAPIDPRARNADVPAALAEFVLRCLAKDRDARFRDAYHFVSEARALAERLDVGWGAMGTVSSPPSAAPSGPPGPPSDVSLTIPAPAAIPSAPSAVLPESGAGEGPAGAARWRERFDALDVLARNDLGGVDDAVLAGHLEEARQRLVELESAVAELTIDQQRLEDAAQDARDFRKTLGRAIDRLARAQSEARGRRDTLEARRAKCKAEREALQGANEGQSDALLWELASLDESLRGVLGTLALGETRLRELRGQLMRKNDEAETLRRESLVRSEEAMVRCDALASALRSPLDAAEQIVRAQWD